MRACPHHVRHQVRALVHNALGSIVHARHGHVHQLTGPHHRQALRGAQGRATDAPKHGAQDHGESPLLLRCVGPRFHSSFTYPPLVLHSSSTRPLPLALIRPHPPSCTLRCLPGLVVSPLLYLILAFAGLATYEEEANVTARLWLIYSVQYLVETTVSIVLCVVVLPIVSSIQRDGLWSLWWSCIGASLLGIFQFVANLIQAQAPDNPLPGWIWDILYLSMSYYFYYVLSRTDYLVKSLERKAERRSGRGSTQGSTSAASRRTTGQVRRTTDQGSSSASSSSKRRSDEDTAAAEAELQKSQEDSSLSMNPIVGGEPQSGKPQRVSMPMPAPRRETQTDGGGGGGGDGEAS